MEKIPSGLKNNWSASVEFCEDVKSNIERHGAGFTVGPVEVDEVIAALHRMGYVELEDKDEAVRNGAD